VHEGVVAVDQPTRRIGDVNTFLHLFKEQPVTFLGGAAVRDVADHVNRSFLLRPLIGVGGGRDDRESAKAGVGSFREFLITSHGAVRTAGPFAIGMRQGGLASAANDVGRGLANLFEQYLV